MAEAYKRKGMEIQFILTQFIIKSLQSLGGTASRETIKESIAADSSIPISEEQIYGTITSKNGNQWSPFLFDFNFGIRALFICGYIEEYRHKQDIVLTEKGRSANYSSYPTAEDEEKLKQYGSKRKEHKNRINNKNNQDAVDDEIENDEDIQDDDNEQWKVEVLEKIKRFSPQKFENFSRLLLSKMGIQFDPEKGVKMSGDHGIDGYGYCVSDEFKTSIVVVQCKRFTDNPVSEPDIDKFKGTMSKHSADYGIFITTTYFTASAKEAALQGNNKVTIIDGNKLVALIEKYQLHIQPIQTYELGDYYDQEN